MNENNQPQSQQTKREPGFYHIKIRQYGPRGTDGHEPRINDKWTIAIWDGKDFEEFNELYHEDEVVEIDERRIERASSESSHSPTEQPGDAKHTPGPWFPAKWNPMLILSSSGDFGDTNICTVHDAAANAELIARAPALLSEVSTLRSKQAKLVAWNQKLREYITAEREISQRFTDENAKLRSELDKLKSDRDAWKGMIAPILDFAQQNGKQLGIRPGESIPEKVLEILKSAISGGSK